MTRAWTRDQRGIVMLEMLLCLTPVMLMFMATIQASLLSVAHLVVRHAAQRGARTASVVLEEDPKYFGDSPRGRLHLASAASGESSRRLPTVAETGGSFTDMLRTLTDREPSRINAIRTAVYLPTALIGPALDRPMGDASSVSAAIDHHALSRFAGGVLYNLAATAVTFPQAPNSDKPHKSDYGPTDNVTVRVTHLFKCEVPIAAALICDRQYALHLLPRERKAMSELKEVEMPALGTLLKFDSGRFATLRAEATLPIHGARYYARQP